MCWFCRKKQKVEPKHSELKAETVFQRIEIIEHKAPCGRADKIYSQKLILRESSPISVQQRQIQRNLERKKSGTVEDTAYMSHLHVDNQGTTPKHDKEPKIPISCFSKTPIRRVSESRISSKLHQESSLSNPGGKKRSLGTLNVSYDQNNSRPSKEEGLNFNQEQKISSPIILMSPIKTKNNRALRVDKDRIEESRDLSVLKENKGLSISQSSHRKGEASDSFDGSINNSDLAIAAKSPKNLKKIELKDSEQVLESPSKQVLRKQSTEQSISSKLRSRGYRTLKYTNILDNRKDQVSPRKNEDSKNYLSTLFNQTTGLQNNVSVLVCEQDDINKLDKNNFSIMDFSINQSTGQPTRSRSVRSQTRIESRQPIRRQTRRLGSRVPCQGLSQDRDNIEIRENKDLNTTYIRSTGMIAPKHAERDLGMKMSGMRTKINQYVIVKSLGKGAWGEVYLVVDIDTKIKYVG